MEKEEYLNYLKGLAKTIGGFSDEVMNPADALGFLRLQFEVYHEIYHLTDRSLPIFTAK